MVHGPIDIFNHLTGIKGFDYDQITEEIFVGTNMCCQYGFARELLAKGVWADISLEENRIDAPNGVRFFLWLPTPHRQPPPFHELTLGVLALTHLVRGKIKVYVHCKSGHGRASTLVAAYFISTGMGWEEAVKFLKQKRPSVHLTDSQVEALKNFQLVYNQKPK